MKITCMLCTCAIGLILAGLPTTATALEGKRTQEQVQEQVQEQIYGSQLMTEEERRTYYFKMRNATSDEERQKIRHEHHEQMKVRAEQQGVSLPETAPEVGSRKGLGPQRGMGLGPERSPGKGTGGGYGGGGKR